MQLVWTHLPTLDGVNNWAANFRGHFHIREKSHAECKGGGGGGGGLKKKSAAHGNTETWKHVDFCVNEMQGGGG